MVTLPGYKFTGLENGKKFLGLKVEEGVEIGDEIAGTFALAFAHFRPLGGFLVIETLDVFAEYIGNLVNDFTVADKP